MGRACIPVLLGTVGVTCQSAYQCGSRHPVFARLTQPELDAVLRFIADNGFGTAPEKSSMKALPMVTHTISVSQPPGATYEE